MIPAVIVDDEMSNIENLTILLNKYCPKIYVAGTATNAAQGLLLIRTINPALLFLDIQMPEKGGFDLLKSIATPDFEVIFVTAYDQYAIQAIKFAAIDYLLKPVAINELINAVDRAVVYAERKMQNERLTNLIRSMNSKNQMRLAIPGNKETLFISPEEILFCKADNNYTIFYMKNNSKHTSSKPIFEYETLLSAEGFTRCHQSYLVNIHFIKSWIKIDGDRLLLEGGHEIPVARNRKEKVKRAIGIQ
ncbi:LytR/AlgR family response regulator transcription factor [Niabella beijingensis]|uniref:LytR/AlgR family response regulator transcription factor n=1 Tax=Niabella beijingensis TaxID=2872700 RepID=UPI001CC1A32E|nr:LytTR family DNA-binding domain-containing protein [Niabella beijingensis]MBZ4188882.1 LytTR family DNA-binding domain-containing protein [Niabella beijingensis]